MWLVKDYCGFVLVFITWNLIIYAEFTIIYVLLWSYPWNYFKILNLCVFQIMLTLALISHIKSMFTDPGTIKLKLISYDDHKQSQLYYASYERNGDLFNSTANVKDPASVKLIMESDEEYDYDDNISYKMNIESHVSTPKISKRYMQSVCNLDSDNSETEMFLPNDASQHDLKKQSFNELHPKQKLNKETCYLNGGGVNNYKAVFRCLKCYSLKPERAHHCSTCKKCINKMDHHCPWINNCVGENNQKFFVLFNLYIMLAGYHALFLIGHHTYRCLHSEWQECTKSFDLPTAFLLIVFLTFEALLFSIFCSIMTGMQIHRILTDTTAIEALKRKNPNYRRPNNETYSFQRNDNSNLNDQNSIIESATDNFKISPNSYFGRFDLNNNFNNNDNNYSSTPGIKRRRVIYNLKEVFGEKPSLKWLSPFHTPQFKPRYFESPTQASSRKRAQIYTA